MQRLISRDVQRRITCCCGVEIGIYSNHFNMLRQVSRLRRFNLLLAFQQVSATSAIWRR